MDRRAPAAPCVLDDARRAGIVGASLVIVREGKVEADEYVGYQENATRRPVDRDTI